MKYTHLAPKINEILMKYNEIHSRINEILMKYNEIHWNTLIPGIVCLYCYFSLRLEAAPDWWTWSYSTRKTNTAHGRCNANNRWWTNKYRLIYRLLSRCTQSLTHTRITFKIVQALKHSLASRLPLENHRFSDLLPRPSKIRKSEPRVPKKLLKRHPKVD